MEQKFKRLVIAAYRLPFKFVKIKNGYKAQQNSGGLVSAMLSLSENYIKSQVGESSRKIVWAGVADSIPDDINTDRLENEHFELRPVSLSSKMNDSFYNGFCNDLLWPLFHYFPSYAVFNPSYYEAFEEANHKFFVELEKIIQPGDFVWIHDYHLMLLPKLIRRAFPDSTIGFFLHIPFPSSEIFRLLPRHWRESIIHGLLGADLIGFHTHDYAQHFIRSVKRTSGFECRQNNIYANDSVVKADAFPIGIDFNKFHDACMSPPVIKEKEKIKKHLFNQKLIFSVDRLDYSKGLLLRLKGYETFLETYPNWHSRVVFNMVVVPSRDNIEKYKEMKREIEYTVGRINGKYSSLAWRPIVYQYKSLTFNELVALYDLSDVGLITPLRDGMNLVAKEYIASQIENKGVLVLSEMTGAAAELNEAIIINPVDTMEMAKAIHAALDMEIKEKHSRLFRMQNRISNYNVFTWATDFFQQAFEVKEQQQMMSVRLVNKTIQSQVVASYAQAPKRILFLDYDGTLVPFAKYPELAIIDRTTRSLIKRLASIPQNELVIISGRSKEFLEKQFHGINLTLVAEHGYFIKTPGSPWNQTVQTDPRWKDSIKPILEEYVNRCNGSFIEEKTGSIAWHYRNVDMDYAQLRLFELRDDLSEIIRSKTGFEILEGNKVLEVKSGRYDKGEAASQLLKDKTFDFIFAAGDDKTDEFLFKALPEEAFTFKIGVSPTLAKYNVPNHHALIQLLNNFIVD